MNAFSPMYGAIANGRLAYRPITSVPTTAVITVATIEGPSGIPAAFKMAGLTAIMYDIVTNVRAPPAETWFRQLPGRSNLLFAIARESVPADVRRLNYHVAPSTCHRNA